MNNHHDTGPTEVGAWLTRVRLKRNTPVNTIAPIVLGHGEHPSTMDHSDHHLIWSLFADHNARRRDFLWRNIGRERYLVLSQRKPVDEKELFELDDAKAFNPHLVAGNRLEFSMKANPVVRKRTGEHRRVTKHDIVMDALRDVPSEERRHVRSELVHRCATEWLVRQGTLAGFTIDAESVHTAGYDRVRVGRKRGRAPMQYSTMEITGTITIIEPQPFIAQVKKGFGAARGFGCGLMALRRAH